MNPGWTQGKQSKPQTHTHTVDHLQLSQQPATAAQKGCWALALTRSTPEPSGHSKRANNKHAARTDRTERVAQSTDGGQKSPPSEDCSCLPPKAIALKLATTSKKRGGQISQPCGIWTQYASSGGKVSTNKKPTSRRLFLTRAHQRRP